MPGYQFFDVAQHYPERRVLILSHFFVPRPKLSCPSLGGSPVGLLATLLSVCVSVCLSVRSINAWGSNCSLNRLSTGRREWDGFTSRPVLSGPWSPTPCRLVLKVLLFVLRARVCMTVLFQCKLWLLLALFILHCTKSGPPPSLSRCSITGSRMRAQQVGWCRCTCAQWVQRSTSVM